MGTVRLLTMFLCAMTLVSTCSSEVSPYRQSTNLLPTAGAARNKRQYSSNDGMENVLSRISELEEDVAKSQTTMEGVQQYFRALGFHQNIKTGSVLKSHDPCGSYSNEGTRGHNEITWTRFGTSKCIKFISGLFTFDNATSVCSQQFKSGEDIAYPKVLTVDSSNNMDNFGSLLGKHSVWIVQSDASPSLDLNCTEFRMSNLTVERVNCGRLKNVVCEKPVIVSYVELVERQLETKMGLEVLQVQIRNLREEMETEKRFRNDEASEIRRLIKELGTSSVASTADEQTHELQSADETTNSDERASDETNSPQRTRIESTEQTLEVFTTSTEGKLRTVPRNLTSFKELEHHLRGYMDEFFCELQEDRGNCRTWVVGKSKMFNIQKAMGVWHTAEGYEKSSIYSTDWENCEHILHLQNFNTINVTQNYRYDDGLGYDERTYNFDYNVETHNPHIWTHKYFSSSIIWAITDYDTWAIVLNCQKPDFLQCSSLTIRKRTILAQATLERLRVVVEDLGFPMEHRSFDAC